jgi:preprotein translocase subunit SecG
MLAILTFVHVIVCLFLIGVVLLQSGKAADLAGAFGGMGSQTAFGPRGAATILSKLTTAAAAVFMVTSLSLSIVATRTGAGSASTVLQNVGKPKQADTKKAGEKQAPAVPSTGPSVTFGPEGADPSQLQTIPLPLPEEAKKDAEKQKQKQQQQKK